MSPDVITSKRYKNAKKLLCTIHKNPKDSNITRTPPNDSKPDPDPDPDPKTPSCYPRKPTVYTKIKKKKYSK